MPELPQQLEGNKDTVDIIIEKKDIPKLWNELSSPQKKLVVKRKSCHVSNSRYRYIFNPRWKNNNCVTIKDYEEDIARIYVLGTCMGSLLMQQESISITWKCGCY